MSYLTKMVNVYTSFVQMYTVNNVITDTVVFVILKFEEKKLTNKSRYINKTRSAHYTSLTRETK